MDLWVLDLVQIVSNKLTFAISRAICWEGGLLAQHGKLSVRQHPDLMGKALGIVYQTIATWLIQLAGLTHDTAPAGAVTFI